MVRHSQLLTVILEYLTSFKVYRKFPNRKYSSNSNHENPLCGYEKGNAGGDEKLIINFMWPDHGFLMVRFGATFAINSPIVVQK